MRTLHALRPFLAALLAPAVLVAGCARGRPAAPIDPVALGAASPAAPTAPLGFDDAVRAAIAGSPELAALRAAAGGVNTWPAPEPLGVSVGDDSDGRVEAGL